MTVTACDQSRAVRGWVGSGGGGIGALDRGDDGGGRAVGVAGRRCWESCGMPGRSSAGSGRTTRRSEQALTTVTPAGCDRAPRPGTPQLLWQDQPGVSAWPHSCRAANSAFAPSGPSLSPAVAARPPSGPPVGLRRAGAGRLVLEAARRYLCPVRFRPGNPRISITLKGVPGRRTDQPDGRHLSGASRRSARGGHARPRGWAALTLLRPTGYPWLLLCEAPASPVPSTVG